MRDDFRHELIGGAHEIERRRFNRPRLGGHRVPRGVTARSSARVRELEQNLRGTIRSLDRLAHTSKAALLEFDLPPSDERRASRHLREGSVLRAAPHDSTQRQRIQANGAHPRMAFVRFDIGAQGA